MSVLRVLTAWNAAVQMTLVLCCGTEARCVCLHTTTVQRPQDHLPAAVDSVFSRSQCVTGITTAMMGLYQ